RAEAHVPLVMVVGEGERVVGIEPAVVRVAALSGRTERDHRDLLGGMAPPRDRRRPGSIALPVSSCTSASACRSANSGSVGSTPVTYRHSGAWLKTSPAAPSTM